MKLVAEISLYPLAEVYIAPIQDFIDRLNTYQDVEVKTNATSTQVAGEYQTVLAMLGTEMERTHREVGQAIFVCKFLNGDRMSGGI